ncbi:MAG: dihydrofolate reductase [Clostridium cadaveris]|uniref:Dihydrofolate reductase n=1 Tax=Clostridium cadaveris TaxID=1529 RepID=A0A316MBC5_9CLOT|nr:MAG: dihydrofolate reductase [Clostridium cadaveris]
MFKKIVAIDNVGLNKWGENELQNYSKEVKLYYDTPQDNSEIIKRIEDADCVLVSYTTNIDKEVIENCPSIKYIGMCCSLYDEKSANVDISCAKEKGITVLGIKDYGDEGVVAYTVSELLRLMHGFGQSQWKVRPSELTNEKVGIIGLGTTGYMVAKALQAFGADIYYYSRTRKPNAEAEDMKYLPLHDLLKTVSILSTNLNKNTVLLYEDEFKAFGHGKILINTTLGPTFSVEALKNWLNNGDNYYLSDGAGIMNCGELRELKNVIVVDKVSGSSYQCTERLSKKVLDNIKNYLNNSL